MDESDAVFIVDAPEDGTNVPDEAETVFANGVGGECLAPPEGGAESAAAAVSAGAADGEGQQYSIEDLIPLCVQHASGPKMTTSTFGYDIGQMERRPWAEPGAKTSDYFNYGFNEGSWRLYCMMQDQGEDSLVAQARDVLLRLQNSVFDQEGGAEAARAPGMTPAPVPMPVEGGARVTPEAAGGAGFRYGENPYIQPPMHQQAPSLQGGFPQQLQQHGGGGGGAAAGGFHRGGNGPVSFKTRLCRSFQHGHCPRGSKCTYAHGPSELRTDDPHGSAPGMSGGGRLGSMQGPGPMMGGSGGAPAPVSNMYPQPPQSMQAAPQQQQHSNYLVPPFRPGAALPPMQGMPMEDDGNASGFRAPKRTRSDQGPGQIYEPQY